MPKKKAKDGTDRGRPLKFKSVKELQEKIDAYFESCWGPKIGMYGIIKDKETGEVVQEQIKPYTVSGLAAFLETDRQTLLNYQERDEFFDTIKSAKMKCEAYAEEKLFTGKQAVGPIFSLSNNYKNWHDVRETKHSGEITTRYTDMTDEELEQHVRKLEKQAGIT